MSSQFNFVAYLKTEEQEVDSQLKRVSPRSQRHLGLHFCTWQKGAIIFVRAHGRHLMVEPSEQRFIWEGNRIVLNFDVRVDGHAPEGTTIVKV
jgi:hypothetical protein